MNIKIQIDTNLETEDVIGTMVSDDLICEIIGEVISYDKISGLAICELY